MFRYVSDNFNWDVSFFALEMEMEPTSQKSIVTTWRNKILEMEIEIEKVLRPVDR